MMQVSNTCVGRFLNGGTYNMQFYNVETLSWVREPDRATFLTTENAEEVAAILRRQFPGWSMFILTCVSVAH